MSAETGVKFLTPQWLNNDFFEGMLQKYYKEPSLEVENFELRSNSTNGTGFTSSMFPVIVNFKRKSTATNQVST